MKRGVAADCSLAVLGTNKLAEEPIILKKRVNTNNWHDIFPQVVRV